MARPMSALTFDVGPEHEGQRLDRFLVSVLETHSRSQIQRLIKEGHVRVAGRAAKANQPVKPGQAIDVDIPEPVEATPKPEALPLPILFLFAGHNPPLNATRSRRCRYQ